MNLKLVRPFLRIFYPISILWEMVYRLRRFLYDVGYFKQNNFKVPVISIGNLALGGTGKTPFTLWLGKYLNDKNKRVMVLTRGYKGKLEKKSGIIRSKNILSYNPYEYGDEALVICRHLKDSSVVVGRDRSQNLRYYFEEEKPDIVLLDDGHQHLKVARNLNFVLFDATLPLEQYSAPPTGYLREGLTALKDADAIILGRVDLVSLEHHNKLEKMLKKYCLVDVPLAKIKYVPNSVKNIAYQNVLEVSELSGKNVMAVTGIASPNSFTGLLESLGAVVKAEYFYPDHHFYTSEEIEQLLSVSKKEKLYLLTTEKDIVKIRKVSQSLEILYIDINIVFEEGEREIKDLVDSVVKR